MPPRSGVCAYGERQNLLPLNASTQLLTPVWCPLQLTYWSQALHGCGRIAAAGTANSSIVLIDSANAHASSHKLTGVVKACSHHLRLLQACCGWKSI